MKRLALGVAIVLIAESMAKADDPQTFRGAGQGRIQFQSVR
jgi:hypothetical protein